MPSRHDTKTILHDRHLAPQKRFGQNFLVNDQIVAAILDRAAPAPSDTIIEFGVGLGALTLPLAQRVKEVIGIEIDAGIVKWHEEHGLPANVRLLHQDLLRTDFGQLARATGGRLKIISNLPYSISNPVLFLLLEQRQYIDSAVLMLQKEVAERLVARPGTKDYGVLSVLLGACSTVTGLLTIGPEHFHPRPKVDSMVVRIAFPHPQPTGPEVSPGLLKDIVKTAFQQRRKTMVNALAGHGKDRVREALREVAIDERRRPDQLSVAEYLALALSLARETRGA